MTTSILVTKLFIPPTRQELIPRPRLIEKMDEGLHSKLILISAPAGFGKTTLLSSWIEENSLPVAFADADNSDTSLMDPAPTLNLLRNASYQIYLELPVIDNP